MVSDLLTSSEHLFSCLASLQLLDQPPRAKIIKLVLKIHTSPGTERWGKVCHCEIYILGGDGVVWGLGSKQTTKHRECLHAKSLQSWPTLCYPMDCSPPGSSAHGILQARILKWVAMPSSRDLPNPGIEPTSLASPSLADRFYATSATWEALFLSYFLSIIEISGLYIFLSFMPQTFFELLLCARHDSE